jgi:Family of unknown function (DUF695)
VSNPFNPCAILNENHSVYLKPFPNQKINQQNNTFSMQFFKNILGIKDKPIANYADFWKWFQQHERSFFKAVQSTDSERIQKEFFDKIEPKLAELNDGFYYLTGMEDEKTADLVITAEGEIKNIVFVEELVAAAPRIKGWQFTPLKPTADRSGHSIGMSGYSFGEEEISFYANEDPNCPDEIDISFVHKDLTDENYKTVANGTLIFVDNYLGELAFLTDIDTFNVVTTAAAEQELVPISKLKAFLKWRKKEFVEKYEHATYDIEQASYSVLEMELEDGTPLVATANLNVWAWEGRTSHPWLLNVVMDYDGEANHGMPPPEMKELLEEVEDRITAVLKDEDGYVYIARETGANIKEVFIACRDFRLPSKVLHDIKKEYASRISMEFTIRKDKYWRALQRFDVED